MHDANEMECLIFENAIKNILLGKVTKSGVSDANNKLIITIFQMWGHIDPIRSGIGLNRICSMHVYAYRLQLFIPFVRKLTIYQYQYTNLSTLLRSTRKGFLSAVET